MQADDLKRLGLIQKLLQLAILLLVIAEIAYILQSFLSYVWGVVGACVVLLARFLMYRFGKQSGWQHVALMVLPLLVILGPLLYVLLDLIIVGGVAKWLDLFLLSAFVLPIVIMFFASRNIKAIVQRNPA